MNPFEKCALLMAIAFGAFVLVNLVVRGIFWILRHRISGMNRFEKIAWYNLATFGMSLPAFFVFLWGFNVLPGHGSNVQAALILTAILGMSGLPSGLKRFKKDRPEGAPEMDERDQMIKTRAMVHVGRAFIAACLLFMFGIKVSGEVKSISLTNDFLMMAFCVGWGFARVVSSLSTVIQYRIESLGGNSAEIGLVPEIDWDRYVPLSVLFMFGIVILSFAMLQNWLLVVVFTPLISSSLQLCFQTLIKDENDDFTRKNNVELRIMEWAMCVFFILSFLASIPAIVLMYRAHDISNLVAGVPMLGIGALVFLLAVKDYITGFFRKYRHENS